MVRKTTTPAKARTTPAKDEVKTPEADAAAAAAKVAPAADKDTQGAEEAASTAQSPTAPPAEIAQAPAAGGEELSSGGTVPAPEPDPAAEPVEPSDKAQPPVAEAELISPEAATALANSEAGALEQIEEPASPVRLLTVTCLRSEGRRRADRRWPEGETVLPLDELTPRQIATLEADPLFIVKRPAD
ncbi:hypothetical protein [Salipiger marinus]|uniref:hypothetical protein n=1 Tax=Salipiger marinus TaxID=555512 RepID=UPI004058C243